MRSILVLALTLCGSLPALAQDEPPTDEKTTSGVDLSPEALIRAGVAQLLACQDEQGEWPYEGVYRVEGRLPIGYRIGGTAIVLDALLHADPSSEAVRAATDRGLAAILTLLEHPLMEPSKVDAYDVRVWGHTWALELFCRLRAKGEGRAHADAIGTWIPRLVAALLVEELPGGGWNYASRRAAAAFVTAPVVQTLLLARAQGEAVPPEVFTRARAFLESSRGEGVYFTYSGSARQERGRVGLPGSIARSANVEATLHLLGGGSPDDLATAVDAFFLHWDELEKRRKKTGTHVAPYGIAPYYFYYGHRYAGLAIELLPPEARERDRARLLEVLLRTRDADGSWNDRVFARSRAYGTAMVILALLRDRQPLPPPAPG